MPDLVKLDRALADIESTLLRRKLDFESESGDDGEGDHDDGDHDDDEGDD